MRFFYRLGHCCNTANRRAPYAGSRSLPQGPLHPWSRAESTAGHQNLIGIDCTSTGECNLSWCCTLDLLHRTESEEVRVQGVQDLQAGSIQLLVTNT
eukprot:6484483-Amphidinium_carterae.1